MIRMLRRRGVALWWRGPADPRRRSLRGQSIVELAIFMPLILTFGLACLQFAVIFAAYMNVIQVTRDAARWVSVHPHVIDTGTGSTDALIRSRLPSGVSSAALTMSFNPPCTTIVGGRCTTRITGSQISVTSTYVITSHLFLPSSFGWGSLVVAIPQTLPAYTIYMQVEPS